MANLVETSNNDHPAISGENTVTSDQLVQMAIAQNKTIFEIDSGTGIRGKGVVGVEAIGSERGIVARGKTAIFCQGDDTSLSALAGNGVAIRGASLNGVGLEISGARVAARFTGNVEISGDLDVSVIRSLLQRISSLEQRVARLENPPPPPARPRVPPPHGGKGGGR